jgi:hypothetical protein
MTSPSGDLYATREQVTRLEEIITQQQAVITNLQQQRDFFSTNIDVVIQEQIDELLKKGSTRSIDYMNLTKFVTKHIASAVSQIQIANTKLLQESIPIKTLQVLEKRLLAKPCASDDIASVSARLSALEDKLHNKQIQQVGQLAVREINTEEVEQLRKHIQHIEDNLIKQIQRSNTDVTKLGELSGPFMKLQQQVDFLQRDIQNLKSVDGQALAEKLITNSSAILRHEFQDYMSTRASDEEVKRLSAEISRIEEFSREVQTGFYSMRNKSQKLMEDMTNTFSVEKWNRLANHFKKDVLSSVEMLRKQFEEEIYVKTAETKHILEEANTTVKRLDREIRIQYGPEMLQRHLTEIQQRLEIQQAEFKGQLEKGLENKVDIMEKQLNSFRQSIREFTAEVRSEISDSKLLEKYAEFETRFAYEDSVLKQWEAKISHLNSWQMEFKEQMNQEKAKALDYIKGFEGELNTVRHSINLTKQEIRKELQRWLNGRQGEIQVRFAEATEEVTALRDQFLQLKGDIQTELVEQKQREKYLEYQAKLENILREWLHQKDDYLITKLVDVNHQVETMITKVDKREEHFNQVFSEDTIHEYVSVIEKNFRLKQEEYNTRRMEEYNSRYLKLEKMITVAQNYINEGRNLQKDLDAVYNDTALKKYLKDIEGRLKTFQGDWMVRKTDFFQTQFSEIKAQIDRFAEIATTAEEREKRLAQLYGDESLQKFVSEAESRIKSSQDAWITRRNTEITNRYDEFKQQIVKVLKIAVETQDHGKKLEKMYADERMKLKNHIHDYLKEVEEIMKVENNTWQDDQNQRYNERYLELQNELNNIKERERVFVDWQRSHDTVCKRVLTVSDNLEDIEQMVIDKLNDEVKKFDQIRGNLENELHEELHKYVEGPLLKDLREAVIQSIQEKLNQIHIQHAKKELDTVITSFNSLKEYVETIENRLDVKILEELDAKYSPILENNIQTLSKKIIEINQRLIKSQIDILQKQQNNLYYNFEKGITERFNEEDAKTQEMKTALDKHYGDALEFFKKNSKFIIDETATIKKQQEKWMNAMEGMVKEKILQGYKSSDLRAEFSRHFEEEIQKFTSDDKLVVLREGVLSAIRQNLREIYTEYARYEFLNILSRLNSIDDRLDNLNTNNRLSNNPWNRLNSRDEMYTGMTKCFFTAIFGLPGQKVDSLGLIDKKLPGWDYICFTNQENLVGNGWTVIHVNNTTRNPALEAKKYKWLSHKYLLDYDIVVWVDAYIAPRAVYSELIKQWILKMMNENISIYHRPHDERNCVYEECEAVVQKGKDKSKNVEKIKGLLTEAGVPKHGGLFDTNVLIKLHKNQELQEICEHVYNRLENSSIRDQLVVPLVYHRQRFKKFATDNLIRAFEKSGTHIRKGVES